MSRQYPQEGPEVLELVAGAAELGRESRIVAEVYAGAGVARMTVSELMHRLPAAARRHDIEPRRVFRRAWRQGALMSVALREVAPEPADDLELRGRLVAILDELGGSADASERLLRAVVATCSRMSIEDAHAVVVEVYEELDELDERGEVH